MICGKNFYSWRRYINDTIEISYKTKVLYIFVNELVDGDFTIARKYTA